MAFDSGIELRQHLALSLMLAMFTFAALWQPLRSPRVLGGQREIQAGGRDAAGRVSV